MNGKNKYKIGAIFITIVCVKDKCKEWEGALFDVYIISYWP